MDLGKLSVDELGEISQFARASDLCKLKPHLSRGEFDHIDDIRRKNNETTILSLTGIQVDDLIFKVRENVKEINRIIDNNLGQLLLSHHLEKLEFHESLYKYFHHLFAFQFESRIQNCVILNVLEMIIHKKLVSERMELEIGIEDIEDLMEPDSMEKLSYLVMKEIGRDFELLLPFPDTNEGIVSIFD